MPADIEILDEYNVENAKDKGMSTTEDCLMSYDSFDAIVCQNDDAALRQPLLSVNILLVIGHTCKIQYLCIFRQRFTKIFSLRLARVIVRGTDIDITVIILPS